MCNLILKLKRIFNNENTHSRNNNIKNTAFASAAAKIIGITVQLITVPLTLGYLGEERYGLWMAITSLIAFLQLSDLGISNALIGMVASIKSRDEGEIMALMLHAVKLLSAIAIIIIFLGTLVTFYIDWISFFNVKDDLIKSELRASIYILLLLFCIGLPLSVAQQTRTGLQQGNINAMLVALGQLLNLLLIFVVVVNKGSMIWLVSASMSGTITLQFFNFSTLLIKLGRHKRQQYDNIFHTSKLFHKSMLFFILQIAGLISYQSDVLVISHFLSPTLVTEYSITLKVFSLPAMLLSFFFVGMWPAYSDAFAKNDKSWIVHYFWRSLKLSLFANTILSLLLYFTGAYIINIWTKGVVRPGSELLMGMVFWGILNAFGGNIATLLNGLHIVRYQVVLAIIAAIFNIILSIQLVKYIGISGPIWGSVIVLFVQYLISIKFIMNLFKGWNIDSTIKN
jgi:O-antigen/teichoic acid export membrane protein